MPDETEILRTEARTLSVKETDDGDIGILHRTLESAQCVVVDPSTAVELARVVGELAERQLRQRVG